MSKPTLVIGNKKYSSWSLRPWLLLKHSGIDFDEIRIPLDTPEFKEQVRQYSGAARVPVYIVDGHAIWDSLAIAESVAESHPELWPEDPVARAFARSIVAEMHSGFTALRSELPMNCAAHGRQIEISAAALSDIQRIETLWQQCAAYHDGQGSWLFGRFSIADAFYAPVVVRFQGYNLPLHKATRAYCDMALQDAHLRNWMADGEAESEVLDIEEAGTV
mgnify:FL=1